MSMNMNTIDLIVFILMNTADFRVFILMNTEELSIYTVSTTQRSGLPACLEPRQGLRDDPRPSNHGPLRELPC